MKKMKITIHKDGTQKIEVLGATGEECVAFTKQLENRLGAQVGDRELKPEYQETEPETERDREVER
ncbi:MAG: DUF2997 domain-containing protein [Acidobacteria bacterium]|nr:DUF2997 domain-containing protein [Acidobacteriota bacterium]MBI3656086.1 DUF2997 domain-containing protein [Acidobacteriota bacterium]